MVLALFVKCKVWERIHLRVHPLRGVVSVNKPSAVADDKTYIMRNQVVAGIAGQRLKQYMQTMREMCFI
jgi:hypothetical protein